MEKYVITLSRQFASMGRTIAEYMSQELEIAFHDTDIVEQAAERLGVTVGEIGEREETPGGVFGKARYPLGITSMTREIFDVESSIIRDFALAEESCIIVGRCADYVLRDIPRCLNIYVYASAEQRLKNCVELLEMEEANAKRIIPQVDKARALYRFRYCEEYKNEFSGRDIMIDSGKYGPQKTAEILCGIARNVFE